MPTIHPTSIIDPQAQLADDVTIGPYCILEGPVQLGAGTRLMASVHLRGPVVLGTHNTLYPYTCIGFEPQDRKHRGASAGVRIGNHNILREGVTIHAATSDRHPTTVGDHCFLMTSVHMGHDASVGDHCTLVSGSMMGGHSRLDNQVTIGGNASVHQFCRVGRLAFIGGASATSKDLPPFTVASGITNVVGLNLVGLRRNGVTHEAIDEIREAFNILYLRGHSNPVAADMIEQQARTALHAAPLLMELVLFIRQSERGLTPHSMINLRHRVRR